LKNGYFIDELKQNDGASLDVGKKGLYVRGKVEKQASFKNIKKAPAAAAAAKRERE
jgi:hypothetical protein